MEKNNKIMKEAERWKILSGIISEQAPVQPQQVVPPSTQTQVSPQGKPQQNQVQQPQQIDAKTVTGAETATQQALNVIVKQLPNLLQKSSTIIGDKDGQLETGEEQVVQAQPQVRPQNQGNLQQPQQIKEVRQIQFDEGVYDSIVAEASGELDEALIAGLIASAPAIMQLGAKAVGWVGKKINSQATQKVGEVIANAGNKLHHSYIAAIEKIIVPFTKNLKPESRKKAAEAIYLAIIAGLFATSVSAPNVMSAIKANELVAGAQNMLPNILFKLGLI